MDYLNTLEVDSRPRTLSLAPFTLTRMEWHPILAAREARPGLWRMIDTLDREYGTIELRRVNGDVRYKCTYRGDLIGWATSLRVACERVHALFLRDHGPGHKSGAPV